MKYPRIWIAAHGGPVKAALKPEATPEVLEIVAVIGSNDDARWAVAIHPNTPTAVLRWLIANFPSEIYVCGGARDNLRKRGLKE